MEEQRDTVFISYSHHDAAWLERLHVMLKPLTRSGALEIWDDTRISPGLAWQEEIESALLRASVAVLLVTPRFLASDFIHQNELPPLLEAAERKGLRVLWIPVSASLYTESPIARFQAVHDPSKPLDRYLNRPAKLNEELVKIAQLIKAAGTRDARHAPSVGQPGEVGAASPPERQTLAKLKPAAMMRPLSSAGESSGGFVATRMRRRILRIVLIAGSIVLGGIVGTLPLRTWLRSAGSSADQQTPGAGPLLSTVSSQNVNRVRQTLVNQIAVLATLKDPKDETSDPWSVAQMAVALEQLTPFNHARVVKYLQTTRDEKCDCWRYNHAVNDTAVSSWVLLSLAKMQATPERDELKFVLNTQKTDGSWAIIPAGNYPRDSAIYATSWALLVLNEHRRKLRVPECRRSGHRSRR